MSKCKKIWITGGGSGIGQALAWRLADQGNHVVISGRRLDKLENTIDAYHKDKSNTHGKIDSVVFDVSQDGEVEQTAQQLREKLGGVDVAILSAGVVSTSIMSRSIQRCSDGYSKQIFLVR